MQAIIFRRLVLAGLLALMLHYPAAAQNGKYIANHRILASALSMHYGIPASVILAVATIESSGGSSPVARVLKNHFGMVGDNNLVNRQGHKSRYKQYDNEIMSYIDFCKMVTRRRYYAKLRATTDPMPWIKAMSRSGYSEVPEEWEQKVISILQEYKL